MKNLNQIITVLNIIGIIASLIVTIYDFGPIWTCAVGTYLVFVQIIPHIKWKKTKKEKEPD